MTVYDLHCHSTASDGVLSPRALVERAASMGVQVLALTDHDELRGLDEAREVAEALGCSAFLKKPFDVNSLLETVARYINDQDRKNLPTP